MILSKYPLIQSFFNIKNTLKLKNLNLMIIKILKSSLLLNNDENIIKI